MNIRSDAPQVVALKNEVEKIAGTVSSHSVFEKLSGLIEIKCREYVSVTTLERLWGYSTRGSNNISVRILDILARFTGAKDFNNFCREVLEDSSIESEMFVAKDAIICSELTVGTCIRLAWLPDRVCEVEYVGNNRFVAIRTDNSSIKPGDSFSCIQIQKGRELYMDCFARKGEAVGDNRYVVGQLNGLTIVEIL